MKIRMREYNDLVELVVDGNIMQENVDIFKNRLHDLIDNGKIRIVLNFGATSYISSLCLSIIVNIKNRLSNLNGDIKIVMANRLITNLFEITNLNRKLEMYKTLEDANNAFSKMQLK
ncbi:MAG TPA: STAS domain-containing protein [Chitinispirillaceae bacterium]|nr:STAS domain-containing protein [Chitinispirillaceae bacterium]